MVVVRGVVDREPAGGEGGDGALALGFQELLGQRVEAGEVEVAVQAVHGEEERLLGLGSEGVDVEVVPDVLGSPDRDAAVADVVDDGGSLVEGVLDGGAGSSAEIAYIELLDGPRA